MSVYDPSDSLNPDFIKKTGIYIAIGIIFLFLLLCSFYSFYTVNEGNVGIVKRFGRAKQQVSPGLHVKIPFIDTIEMLEIRTRKNLERLNAATHEQMPVQAEVSVNWTVNLNEAFELFKRYGGLSQFESRILDPKLRSASKDALAKYKAEEIIQNRGKVIRDIEDLLVFSMQAYPVKLDSVQLENLVLPKKYIQSIETKQTEKNLADAEKHRLKRQNLEAQREVNTANAKRDAEKARADGRAYAILQEAKAESESIRLRGFAEAEAILEKAKSLQKSKTLVEYTRAQQWDGKLPTTIMGEGQSILWNLNMSQKKDK